MKNKSKKYDSVPEWLKFKKYPHIGHPLTRKDKYKIISYVTNENKIAKHKFTPLLHRTKYQRKFRAIPKPKPEAIGKRNREAKSPKERPLFYASHLDAMVYSYYQFQLNKLYERYMKDKDYSVSAVAYRKIPIKEKSKKCKCNIEFARDSFKFIQNNQNRRLSIVISDITSFFDNLDHDILKRNWEKILGDHCVRLPKDHYNVYKSLVVKRFVNEKDLFNRFKHKLIAERGVPGNNKRKRLRNISLKKMRFMRKENVVAFCSKSDFFRTSTDLIRAEKKCSHQHSRCKGKESCVRKGIPQGTPMSATLANIYMIDFDEKVFDKALRKNAFYQRYSDDIIIVCDQVDEEYFIKLLQDQITNTVNLDIQKEKQKIYRYCLEKGKLTGGLVKSGVVNENKQLEYLGFEFNGDGVLIKTSGFSKFYRNMKRSFRRSTYYASKPTNASKRIFKSRLYKKFTSRGAKRKIIHTEKESSEEKLIVYKRYDWGNYLSYIHKANECMKEINLDDRIAQQGANIWSKFHKEMEFSENEISHANTK